MTRVLVVHASRHGATAGIAERIGATLRTQGIDAVVTPAADLPDPRAFDAVVVGGGVYMGSWVKEGTDYLDRYALTLATRPTWLFSSGPLPGSTAVEKALGPADGPGSGGRKKIDAASSVIHPREHRVFQGAYDPKDPPKAMAERLVRMMPASKGLLPPGDFREWDRIEAWAREIAGALREPLAIG
jgi:menaquinone-dependent protoporphyrinogen oxidase